MVVKSMRYKKERDSEWQSCIFVGTSDSLDDGTLVDMDGRVVEDPIWDVEDAYGLYIDSEYMNRMER